MAAGGRTVFLIDGDLRRPTVATSFGLPDGAGLTDVLIGSAKVTDVVHAVGADRRLHVIAAGNIPPNPTELLGSQTMHRLLADLAREGTVLIDAPPLLPVTDGAVLAANTDGAIVSRDRSCRTRRPTASAEAWQPGAASCTSRWDSSLPGSSR